jgi:nucleotide-binding universal stress UspA family protein
MELRSILVLVRGRESAKAVSAACVLAKRHGASVVGLHVMDLRPIAIADGDLSGRLYEMQREQLLAEAAEAQQVFESIANTTSVDIEWRCEEGSTQGIIDVHARHCDLLCIGALASWIHGDAGTSVIEDLLFSAGRPALIVPAGYSGRVIGENVALAWDASRECARAVSDAMGVLKMAASVSVVTVADSSMDDRESGIIELDVCQYLAKHDIRAQAYTAHPGGTPVGEALHAWTREHGQDLLVMGAYGHSRFREMVLGGTTRWMLRHADIPLLMSH